MRCHRYSSCSDESTSFVATSNVTVSPGSTSCLSGFTVAVSSVLASGVSSDALAASDRKPACGAAYTVTP